MKAMSLLLSRINGDAAADYVEAYVLFFDAENNITDVSSAYVTDDDGEIKPGATLLLTY